MIRITYLRKVTNVDYLFWSYLRNLMKLQNLGPKNDKISHQTRVADKLRHRQKVDGKRRNSLSFSLFIFPKECFWAQKDSILDS